MNPNINSEYNRLVFEDIIWITNIIIALLNIKASSIIKESYISGDESKLEIAQNIFRFNTLVAIFINIYFVTRNYKYYQNAKTKDNSAETEKLRFIGSLLILIGTIIIFYTLNIQTTPEGTPA